jgi:hypothetical protein
MMLLGWRMARSCRRTRNGRQAGRGPTSCCIRPPYRPRLRIALGSKYVQQVHCEACIERTHRPLLLRQQNG